MFTSATTLRRKLTRALGLSGRTGWVGVDFGSAQVKLAQVARTSAGYQFAARWLVQSPQEGWPDRAAFLGDALDPLLPQVRRAAGMVQGRRTAALLPGEFIQLRALSLPQGSRDELRRMVREELLADKSTSDQPPSFDYWLAEEQSARGKGMARVSVAAVEPDYPRRLAEFLIAAGLDCRTVDVAPAALARAALLTTFGRPETPLAVLDLGFSAATFVVASRGRACYTRQLRGCGLRTFRQPLEGNIRLGGSEATQLLIRMGVSPPGGAAEGDTTATAIHHLLAAPLERLIAELRRTLAYVEQDLPNHLPERLLITGGGSQVRNLPQRLAGETGLATEVWSLAGEGPAQPHDALFAAAAGLSALAWED